MKKKEDKPKQELNTSLHVAVQRLNKEAKKPKGLLDKTAQNLAKAKIKTLERPIQSPMLLRRNCSRLMNYLHQTMHHALAIKVNELSKLVKDNMSQKAMQEIINTMDGISKKHGFDFYKP